MTLAIKTLNLEYFFIIIAFIYIKHTNKFEKTIIYKVLSKKLNLDLEKSLETVYNKISTFTVLNYLIN